MANSPGGPYGEVSAENPGRPGFVAYRNPAVAVAEAMRVTTQQRLFTPGTGATPPALTGREREQGVLTQCLADLLGGTSPPHDVVLTGPRGTGKTVLIAGLMTEAQPVFTAPAHGVAHGGVLAAPPMLLRAGLLGAANRLFRLFRLPVG